jgi:hypothetical protein
MGTVNYTWNHIVTGNGIVVTWASLSTGSGSADTGQAFPSSVDYAIGGWLFSDKSIEVFKKSSGTVDTQVIIEGSNIFTEVNPALLTYATLTDPQGNALLFTNATMPRIEQVLENCAFIRPIVTTISSTSMAVDVHMLLSTTRSSRSGM